MFFFKLLFFPFLQENIEQPDIPTVSYLFINGLRLEIGFFVSCHQRDVCAKYVLQKTKVIYTALKKSCHITPRSSQKDHPSLCNGHFPLSLTWPSWRGQNDGGVSGPYLVKLGEPP